MIEAIVMDINPLKAKTLGEFCSLMRQRENITQEDLAKMIGVTRNTVNRTEMGMVERPYQHLRFLKRWMNEAELVHLLDLLRLIDLKNLTENKTNLELK